MAVDTVFVVVRNNINVFIKTLSVFVFLDVWLVVFIVKDVVVLFLVSTVLCRYDGSVVRNWVFSGANKGEDLEWVATVTSLGD